jgi:hypothetical protein
MWQIYLQMLQFTDLQFLDYIFADLIIFCELKTSANTSFVSLSLKCFHLIKFKDYIWLFGKFWDRVTWHFRSLKYTYIGKKKYWRRTSEDLHAFFLENLRICDLRTGTPRKFADLRFEDKSLQVFGFAICRLAHLKNLRAHLWLKHTLTFHIDININTLCLYQFWLMK